MNSIKNKKKIKQQDALIKENYINKMIKRKENVKKLTKKDKSVKDEELKEAINNENIIMIRKY